LAVGSWQLAVGKKRKQDTRRQEGKKKDKRKK
jgi:hypothetical protein